MNEQEILYAMALTRISNFNFQQALELYRTVGSAHTNTGMTSVTLSKTAHHVSRKPSKSGMSR